MKSWDGERDAEPWDGGRESEGGIFGSGASKVCVPSAPDTRLTMRNCSLAASRSSANVAISG